VIFWPVIGWLAAVSRPIWMKRESRHTASDALEKFMETLDNGVSLIVYPEGTSSSGKEGILPFKSSVFEAPAKGGFPVLPIVISYPGMKTEDVCWFGGMTFAPHIWNVLGMKEIKARLDFLPPVWPEGRDRKALANYIREMMIAKFAETNSASSQPKN